MAKEFVKQHEPLRIPDKWHTSDRAFAIQLNRILDEVYALIGNLEQNVKHLQKQVDGLQPEEEEEET